MNRNLIFSDYGCIPHHLMGSDHSAIYCGLQLNSPLLMATKPHELTDALSLRSLCPWKVPLDILALAHRFIVSFFFDSKEDSPNRIS